MKIAEWIVRIEIWYTLTSCWRTIRPPETTRKDQNMNTKIIAVLVALAAALTYAETVQEPLVETHQGSAKKVVPDDIECHHGSLKKPKDAVNCHHGSMKQAKEGAVECHHGSLKKPKAGVNCHHGTVKQAKEGAVECHNGSLKKPKDGVNCHHGSVKRPETAVARETDGDQDNVPASAEAAMKGEVKGY